MNSINANAKLTLLGGLFCAVFAGFGSCTLLGLDDEDQAGNGDVGTRRSDVDPAEASFRSEKMARLARQHDRLTEQAGAWKIDVRHRDGPDDPWQNEQATARSRQVLGGRYLLEEIRGTYRGEPYEALRIHGFDNLEQTWFTIWMDNRGTWPLMSRGVTDDDGALRMVGRWKDAETPGGRPFRAVRRISNGDSRGSRLKVWDTIDREEVLVLDLTYTPMDPHGKATGDTGGSR